MSASDRARWNEKYRAGAGPTQINPRLRAHLHLLTRGRALDLACGVGPNAELLRAWRVTLADISDEALRRARGARVLCDATALPFRAESFDTILSTHFYEPRAEYARWLTRGGTFFLDTFTVADQKYRPDFNRAYLLDPARIAEITRGMEILLWRETDDGRRVYGTLIARKN
ncbi:MAG: class I SAM-dependent methyltransferase [Chloroflexi bacterium]|nr:class I SAM-dependent methyltransferase [Chloroflexota bacterium]